ncbi:ABC transporter ATP-binding protein [Galbitalea soli]|uniref:ATP-binding cassette domain-containing protein n=1 Tax=Galbitalea soli TaxID=1268042 RepID=A0A7C9TRN6_9MICO|nr:ATP-binding cassette domain-containing protein [Galbitalea soli]NEM91143.1 ATP-binding cassette domain-containing protein [Galbitalea soli]NYJ29832.1 ABC-type lipoprotein export system ATPase subunit [Galbitalea soli]
MDSKPVIELRAVTKRYRTDHHRVALPTVSFSANAGELVWLTGPSGSGKSTLLGIAALVTEPDSGEVWLGGVRRDTERRAGRILARQQLVGLMPQTSHLIPELSAVQNLRLSSDPRRAARPTRLLRRVGITHSAHGRVDDLRHGDQTRTSLARALVGDPAIVLADEPSAGLDDTDAAAIFSVLRELADEGRCVVVASHDRRVEHYAHRSVALAAAGSE